MSFAVFPAWSPAGDSQRASKSGLLAYGVNVERGFTTLGGRRRDGDVSMQKNAPGAALAKYQAADAILRVPITGIEVARAQAALDGSRRRDSAHSSGAVPARRRSEPTQDEWRSRSGRSRCAFGRHCPMVPC
jgi:hypothetical protein